MKRNLVLLSLTLLVGASLARAQTVAFDLRTANPLVAQTGLSEVIGQVALIADSSCGAPPGNGTCKSTAGTVTVEIQNVPIDNAPRLDVNGLLPAPTTVTQGIEVVEIRTIGGVLTTVSCPASPCTGTYVNGPIIAGDITDPVTGKTSAVVTFAVLGGITLSAGDEVLIKGIRGEIVFASPNAPGTTYSAFLNESPPTIVSVQPQHLEVATVAVPLKVTVTPTTFLTPCLPGTTPSITATEIYSTVMVDYGPGPTAGVHPSCPVLEPVEFAPGPPLDIDVLPATGGIPDDASDNPCFGATNNTHARFEIVCDTATGAAITPPASGASTCSVAGSVSTLPTGITLTWPTTSTPDPTTGSSLHLMTGDSGVDGPGGVSTPHEYVFNTKCQSLSNGVTETWTLGVPSAVTTSPITLPANCGGATFSFTNGGPFGVALSGTSKDLGTADAHGQMAPADPTNAFGGVAGTRPRFQDPFKPANPADVFLIVGPCVTDLLFPFVASSTAFDTGLAIANTTSDVWNAPAKTFAISGTSSFLPVPGTPDPVPIPVTVPTPPQTGKCSLYYWPISSPPSQGNTPPSTSGGAAPTDPLAYGTAPIVSGDTWISPMSQIPGFGGTGSGYIIAVCDFQYAHGFAFVSPGPMSTSTVGVSAAYIALIIPDPHFSGGRFPNNTVAAPLTSGEGLSQ